LALFKRRISLYRTLPRPSEIIWKNYSIKSVWLAIAACHNDSWVAGSGQTAISGIEYGLPSLDLRIEANKLMIGRMWHGWTKPENADKYETLLKTNIFPGIAAKKVIGYKGIQLFRRPIDDYEVEFVTIMWFDSWDAVKQFAGEEYDRAYVPHKAREVLARFDERSQHYEIRERLDY
jgi:hypothetical protein